MKPVAWQYKCKRTGEWMAPELENKAYRNMFEQTNHETRDLYAISDGYVVEQGFLPYGIPEDIDLKGEEILLWDGADYFIDYVDVDCDTGFFYLANGTEATHWKPLNPPAQEESE